MANAKTIRKKNSLVRGSTKKILGNLDLESFDYHINVDSSIIIITDYLRDGIAWIKSRGKLYLPYGQRDTFWGDIYKVYYTRGSSVWNLREETLRYNIQPKWTGDIYKYNKERFMKLVAGWLRAERAVAIPTTMSRLVLPLPETIVHLQKFSTIPRGKQFIQEDENWREALGIPRRQFRTARQTAMATYGAESIVEGLPDNPEVKKDYDRYR